MAPSGGGGNDSRLSESTTTVTSSATTKTTHSGMQTPNLTPGAFPDGDASGDRGDGADDDVVVVEELVPPLSLSAAVWARRDEFTRRKGMKIKVGSWNVAGTEGLERDLRLWFGPDAGTNRLQHGGGGGDGDIDLYVLGLQEVIDISRVTVAMKTYTDPNPAQRWKTELQQVLPDGFELIAEQQLLGMLIVIFASAALAPSISNVSCTSVGTGLMGYLGNKGAVSVRLLLSGTTRACFINCHLAAGSDKAALDRRLWDIAQILTRTRFPAISLDGQAEGGPDEKIGDEDIAFWFGDLNHRLEDIPGEDVRRLLLLHTENQYGVFNDSNHHDDGSSDGAVEQQPNSRDDNDDDNNDDDDRNTIDKLADSQSEPEEWQDPRSDPTSLMTTIESLLAHDQLRSLQRQRKALHEGWREGEIGFLPTYKYDVGSTSRFDTSEKRRSPSWCDRILFRTRQDRVEYEEQAKQEAEVRKKDEEMKRKGLDEAVSEHNILFDYDPDEDGGGEDYDAGQAEGAVTVAEDGDDGETYDDYQQPHKIEINGYSSHQHVLSSDHKPVAAVFTLTYDAIVPELKAKIQQEVVRDLDKAENENRPCVTLVIDHVDDGDGEVNVVHFGSVAYDVAVHRSVTIANTGQIEATARFIGKENGEGPITARWLTASLVGGGGGGGGGLEATLEPGESKVIDLTARVWAGDGDLVQSLNHRTADLDDVLILRIDGGRDHFLPVKARWLPTCFYRSLDELVVAPESGVRSLSTPTKTTTVAAAAAVPERGPRHSAPKELFALTESIPPLTERSIADWDMLHPGQPPPWSGHQNEGENANANAWPFDSSTWTFHDGAERDMYLAKVRECLDTSQPLDRAADAEVPYLVHVEVLCQTLVSFLGSLQDGIITASMWTAIEPSLIQLETSINNVKDKNDSTTSAFSMETDHIQCLVMEALSSAPVHSVSLTFLTFMLSTLIKQLAPALQERRQQQQLLLELQKSHSRQSRASSILGETSTTGTGRISLDSTATTAAGGPSPKKAGGGGLLAKISPLRRRRADTSTSTSSPSGSITADINSMQDQLQLQLQQSQLQHLRQDLIKTYAAVFAPLIIRSSASTDEMAKGKGSKEKKVLEARKQRVLEAFLEVAQL